ncbi:hypothetical protein ACXHQ9_16095 [Vibrio cincinnatiensis]
MATDYTQEQMINCAVGYDQALCSPEETASSFNPQNGLWEFVAALDISKFALQYFDSPKEAEQWLLEEIRLFEEDGIEHRSNDFKSMLENKIEEPVIIGNSHQDGMALWDGVHRLAAAFATGRTLPAFVGTRIPLPPCV